MPRQLQVWVNRWYGYLGSSVTAEIPNDNYDASDLHVVLRCNLPSVEELCIAKEAFETGLSLAEKGAVADACVYFRAASNLAPAEPTYHLALGQSLQETGRSAEAETELLRTLAIEPDNADALLILGNIYQLETKYELAEPLYRRALQSNRTPVHLSSLGALLGNTARYSEAIRLFDEALAIDPSYEKAKRGRELALFSLARHR